MPEIRLRVRHEVGLHARPAALFVKTAQRYASDISVTHVDLKGNAKSILDVLTLGVTQGSEITIRAEGQDAEGALAALEALVEAGFAGCL